MKEKAHQVYKLANGTRVPSVTTVTGILNKPQLIKWANRLGLDGIDVAKYVDIQAEAGTLAHQFILDYFKGVETDTSEYSQKVIDKAKNSLRSFHKFLSEHNVKPLKAEEQLVSERYKYGGTLDLLADLDGKVVVMDWKTGKGIYKEYGYQLAAYANLVEENFGLKVDGTFIVRINRGDNEEYEMKSFDWKKNFEVFNALLKVYYLIKED